MGGAVKESVRAWSVTDVTDWLTSIELGEHAATFAANAVDGEPPAGPR